MPLERITVALKLLVKHSSVCPLLQFVQQGLHFLHFLLNIEYSWPKHCHYSSILSICLFILKSCIYSVLSWYTQLKHIFCLRNSCSKQYWQDGGIVDLGVETHVLHLCYTELLLAFTLVEMICLHLSI